MTPFKNYQADWQNRLISASNSQNPGKKKPDRDNSGQAFERKPEGLKRLYILRLGSLLARDLFELYALAFDQGAMTFADDRPEMNEQIFAFLSLDETITFGVIEPLDGSRLCL
jgi:hypothetical protein